MFYDFVGVVVRLILALFMRVRVEGLEKVPASGPFLLVSNHLNLIDPPVLGALLPRRVTFMAKEELFRVPIVGLVVKSYGAFSVRRGQPDRQAIRTASDVLRNGGVIGIFPEGTRSKSGKMNEAYPGAALLALMTASTLVPVGISGTDHVRSPLSLLRRPGIEIRVGEPFVLERKGDGKTDLNGLTTVIMSHVAGLVPADRRGFYGGDRPESSSS